MFPYHYGSYATDIKDELKKIRELSFHTTMVLTQLSTALGVAVSELLFPYHYGSYAT